VSDPRARRWILNEVGLCLMSLGRLRDAVPFYERVAKLDQELADDWHNASVTVRNLADLRLHLGDVDAGAEDAREALRLARKAENQNEERDSLAYMAWAEHLRGETEAALAHFAEAEALEQEISGDEYLYSQRGVRHAITLIRSHATPLPRSSANPLPYARRITEANLPLCKQYMREQVSQCHRVLGDLDAIEGQPAEARAHYDEALRIARSISDRATLIEALLARGRYVAKDLGDLGDLRGLDQAFSDLREALALATRGGYRRYEADIRVALAWAHLAATPIPGPSPAGGGRERAREEAERARAMSEAMGYHWGQVDAEAVLDALET
jgi:tetratricopeptide (TPR) repeat protein